MYLGGGPGEPNSWRTVNVFFLPDLSPPKIARSINSIFPKWCAFRLPNPPKIYFSMKGIPQKKIDIPGDPAKTKPVKYIKPPPPK